MATVDLIMFAIEAGVRLGRTGRRIYVESTGARDLVIPLPPAFGTSLADEAKLYANELSHSNKPLYMQDFQQARLAGQQDLVVDTYLLHVQRGLVGRKFSVAQSQLAGLAALRQWNESPQPTALKRVSGSLVEIAIDYFVRVPGAIHADSKAGKTLKSFLAGLSDFDFQESRWDSVLTALFTAGLEAIDENPELLGQDENSLVRTIVAGVAGDVKKRLEGLGGVDVLDAEDRLKQFGQVVLKGVLSGAGRAVVAHPSHLGVKAAGGQALVEGVGGAFLTLLVDGQGSLADGLRSVASSGGLNDLMKAALQATAQHPELFKAGPEVEKWIGNVLTDLSQLYSDDKKSLFDAELLADVAFLAVDHAIDDLSPLLLKKLPGGQQSLVTHVAGEVLGLFAVAASGNKPAHWKFDLSREDVTGVFASTFSALAQHPEWLFKSPQQRKLASAILPLATDVLTQVGAGNDGGLFKALLRAGKLEPVVAGILTSGIFDGFANSDDQELAEKIAKAANKVLTRVADSGLAGLDRVLVYSELHDLLKALQKSTKLDKLLSGTSAEAKIVIDGIVEIVSNQKKGSLMTIEEMTTALIGAAA